MASSSDSGHWAQLVSTTDLESEPILIKENKFIIGRASGCDLCLASNKLVSSKHCYIEKDDTKYSLNDTSTNGTLLNSKTRITKGKSHELKHGDEIHVVFKKDQEDMNIGYLFQVRSELEIEQSRETYTQEYEFDQTLVDSSVNLDDADSVKRKRENEDENDDASETPPKKLKGDEPDSQATEVGSELPSTSDTSKKECDTAGTSAMADEDMLQSLTCIICQEILYDCISLQPCMHSFCSGCYSDWMKTSNECPTCRVNVDRINKNHIVNNCVESFIKAHPDKKRSEEDMKDLDSRNMITRDMLYPPKPRHSTDSDASDDEDEEENNSSSGIINYNPILASLGHGLSTPYGTIRFGQTLRCRQCQQPGQQTSTTDSSSNTVTTTSTASTSCQTAQTTTSDIVPSSTVAATTTQDSIAASNAVSSSTGANSSQSASTSADDTHSPESQTPTTSAADGLSGTHPDDRKIMPAITNYVCTVNQQHISCSCCNCLMPDRRHDTTIPSQVCAMCYRTYCHSYWGCSLGSCLGCIAKFSELTLGRTCLTNTILLDNSYESNILKDYLDGKSLTLRQLQDVCVQKLHSGTYTCPDAARIRSNPNIYMCYRCGLKNYKELAYQYRRDIDLSELPASVTSRPDCYWGRQCRTQSHKHHHAQKFNHICDQTRTR